MGYSLLSSSSPAVDKLNVEAVSVDLSDYYIKRVYRAAAVKLPIKKKCQRRHKNFLQKKFRLKNFASSLEKVRLKIFFVDCVASTAVKFYGI